MMKLVCGDSPYIKQYVHSNNFRFTYIFYRGEERSIKRARMQFRYLKRNLTGLDKLINERGRSCVYIRSSEPLGRRR